MCKVWNGPTKKNSLAELPDRVARARLTSPDINILKAYWVLAIIPIAQMPISHHANHPPYPPPKPLRIITISHHTYQPLCLSAIISIKYDTYHAKFITAVKSNQISSWVDAIICSGYWLTFEMQNTKLWLSVAVFKNWTL